MKRQRTLAVVLCHVWFVNAYVLLPPKIWRQHTRSSSSVAPAAQQHSTVVVLQRSDEIPHQSNITDRLWTYAYNIPKATRQHSTARDQTRPIYSLIHCLRDSSTCTYSSLDSPAEEALERATIQAVRAASTVGDYRLIFLVVESAIDFANKRPILPARLFGEAIESLSRTKCNVSKLKQMWKLSRQHESLIQEPGISAFELNTMLRALASRGKIRAALDLFDLESIEGDAYTMSTLLTALTSSISDDQSPAKDWKPNNSESPCWQFNEGRKLVENCSVDQLNNFVFAAALRLNERAGQVFPTFNRCHHTAKSAMDLLQLMKKLEISPDVVTCSLVASAFDKAFQSKAAVALLDAMVKGGTESWSMPAPNEYVYSSVISACARCNDYESALQVLDRIRNDSNCKINTSVYNAALKACVGRSRRSRKKRAMQSQMGLTLLNEMQADYERGMDTAPDFISYNTALAAIDGMGTMNYNKNGQVFSEEWGSQATIAFELLHRMKKNEIPRDFSTYRNAIRVVRTDIEVVLSMLNAALDDLCTETGADKPQTDHVQQEATALFNSALAVLSDDNSLEPIATVLSKMLESDVRPNSETLIHLLNALGSSGMSEFIPAALLGLNEENSSLEEIKDCCGIDIRQLFRTDFNPSLDLQHYSAAIRACLVVDDVDSALKVLSQMRERSISPDNDPLKEIALTYCRLASIASAEESKIGRRVRSRNKKKRTLQMDIRRNVSAARARSALDIALSLEKPSFHLLSAVSKACCSAGMWAEARMLLGRIHNAVVSSDQNDLSANSRRSNDPLSVLPGLHRSLLKLCASKGNATAALGFVDDIQSLSKSLPDSSDEESSDVELLLSSCFDGIEDVDSDIDFNIPAFVHQVAKTDISTGDTDIGIGMTGEDWKLLMIAASKAGNWRLCLGTLQFLKPFLEATNPYSKSGSSRKTQSKRYDKLARSLTAAILCFEKRGQYAWAIRVIEDWIEWSGRRPRKEAVLGAFRILSSRGQGYELNRLLNRILEVPPASFEDSEASSYEEILCTGALNSLHLHGLYEDADVLYVQACTQGYLPFSIEAADSSNAFVLDLHGMNVAMAHSAVRIALQQYALPATQDGDLVIVTGRGMNSAQRLRPVLRPEVQRMLLEEFFPPLGTSSVPGNMGALRVPSQDVKEWVTEQRQQKGARMLAIADVLKNLTSGERIRKSIALKLQTTDDDDENKQGD